MQQMKTILGILTQLLKKITLIYDDTIEITATKGTPQGGWLSPIFFNIALDSILN